MRGSGGAVLRRDRARVLARNPGHLRRTLLFLAVTRPRVLRQSTKSFG